MSVPIRLVQRNGKLISLDATQIQFKFARGTTAIPMPILGERYAADLNIVTTSIDVDVILRDDDCSASDVAEQPAKAFIDFAKPNVRDNNTIGAGSYFYGDGGTGTIGQSGGKDITNKEFQLKSTFLKQSGADPIIIKFIDTGTLGAATYSSGTVSISLNHANLKHASTPSPSSGAFTSIAHEVATYLTNALNNSANIGITTTSTGDTGLSHAFTATLSAGTYNATLGMTRVDIQQDEVGTNGNSGTPVFWDMTSSGSVNTLAVVPPAFQTFRGGENNTCKSAGDKVQDLIANVSNSNVMGAVGQALQMDTNDERKGVSTDFNKLDPTAGATDDYIVGIQIPYNSLIQSADTTSMTARNFLIVTGLSPANNQGSVANKLPASTTFDSENVYTGIRGTVTTFSAAYMAGDTFYSGKLSFAPIDMIVGL